MCVIEEMATFRRHREMNIIDAEVLPDSSAIIVIAVHSTRCPLNDLLVLGPCGIGWIVDDMHVRKIHASV
jgi:hypothetical protein